VKKLVLTAVRAVFLGAPASAVTVDWVTVSDPGNACDVQTGGCFGAVADVYRISKTAVSNAQYAELLNAVDPSGANALGLYNANMGSISFGGIDFVAGNAAGSKYVVKGGFASKPVNSVSFYDSLRFANWLHNGQGAGSTETGVYTLLGGTATPSNGLTVTRNAGATIFLTSEDEWYKAAYYDSGTLSYNPYPFADGFNGAACELPAGTTSHSANCNSAVGALTDGAPTPARRVSTGPSTRAATSGSGARRSSAARTVACGAGRSSSASARASSQRRSGAALSRPARAASSGFAARASPSPVRARS
jgi:hypothetical protein